MKQNNELILEKCVTNIKNNKKEIFDEDTVNKLLKSEDDIENGRVREAKEVMEEFRIRFRF